MNVLFYTRLFAPRIGGVETHVATLSSALRLSGRNVTIATDTVSPRPDAEDDVRVVRKSSLLRFIQLVRNSDCLLLAGPALLPLLLGVLLRKPTIVQHHQYQACCPNGLLLIKPEVTICPQKFINRRYTDCLRCQSASIGKLAGALSILTGLARRVLCKLATINVANTEHVASRLHLRNTSTIHYGTPITFQPVLKPIGPRLTFGFVGRLVDEKGIEILFRAFAELLATKPESKLLIFGDGPLRSGLAALALTLGVSSQIVFRGALKGAELEQGLGEVDVVVIPSVWEEPFGLVAIEQMQRGIPIIASDVGGLAEAVGDAGLLFEVGSVTSLIDRLHQVSDPGTREMLRKRGLARVNRLFHVDRMTSDYDALISRIATATTVADPPPGVDSVLSNPD